MAVHRLQKVAKEFNVGISRVVEYLQSKGIEIDAKPNTKLGEDEYQLLLDEFQSDKQALDQSKKLKTKRVVRQTISLDDTKEERKPGPKEDDDSILIKNVPVADSTPIQKKEEEPAEEPAEKPPVAKEEPKKEEKESPKPEEPKKEDTEEPEDSKGLKVVDKIDLDKINQKTRPTKATKEEKKEKEKPEVKKEEAKPEAKKEEPKKEEEKPKEKSAPEHIETKIEKLSGPNILGKIEVKEDPKKKKPVASSNEKELDGKGRKRRKRIRGARVRDEGGKGRGRKKQEKVQELTEEQIQAQVRETLARLSGGGGKSKSAKHRKAKREAISQQKEQEASQQEEEQKLLRVTEFVTVSELSTMMNVPATDIIAACMSLGMVVSINQRLDAETLTIVAEEFGFQVEFTTEEIDETQLEEPDKEENIKPRSPIVTVMGHVDHGKTSLLDHIRKANVIAGEAGGITQHIGAYSVKVDKDRRITFLDTPGHEAFTAMRSRGAQVTDLVIVVVAADDNVMPQTKEAINHAQAAGVPIVFAINKIDKPGANPDKIKEELAGMNYLVEEWGGKYQSQDISAKNGENIDELLDKVLLEAELLELNADPDKRAVGTVIEASLDKGKGYVSTVIVQSGTLRVGDNMLAGSHYGKVKAIQNERGQNIEEAGPSTPVTILGLNGAPSAGDKFHILEEEKEVKNIANKRSQLQREQGVRAQKQITLDEIGRRIAIGDFQELNVIIKGDVDGSIEALADSLLNLSTEKIQVNVIHKSVGQISESDVLLASASAAVIIGFQVRPSANARKIAEKEQIDIRLYSVIYDAIEEVKTAMEGMLKPKVEEKVVCNLEVRDTFKISKVGTIAGCYVNDGTITRNTKVRLIRDGVVVYTGNLGSLKRFKEDVREVKKGFECGLNIENFNDIKVGDEIEGYEEVEVKQSL